jgi:hypothetical protein
VVVVGLTLAVLVEAPVFQEYVVAPEAVKRVENPAQRVDEFTVRVGVGLITKVAELLDATPQDVAGTVYVTTYVPVELDAKLTVPALALKLKPAGVAEKVPPVVKPDAKVGEGFDPFKQYGLV